MQFVERIATGWLTRVQNTALPPPARSAPHVTTASSVPRVHLWFVIASLPIILAALIAQVPGGGVVSLGIALVRGLIPVLGVSLAWHLAFAVARCRPLDSGWLMHGWLFCLLMPTDLSLPLALLGVSFGVVLGSLIFGGTGRYLVSPAMLGIVFVSLSYPATFNAAQAASDWGRIAATSLVVPDSWAQAALFQASPTIAGASAAACLLGALTLYIVGAISLRIVAGALLGMACAAYLVALTVPDTPLASLPAFWHWIAGNFPFCVAFIATDPTAAAVTRPGRWLYGGLIGALTVMLRIFNPEHPEGALAACLLASLFAPLMDQCCQRIQIYRHKRLQEAHGPRS